MWCFYLPHFILMVAITSIPRNCISLKCPLLEDKTLLKADLKPLHGRRLESFPKSGVGVWNLKPILVKIPFCCLSFGRGIKVIPVFYNKGFKTNCISKTVINLAEKLINSRSSPTCHHMQNPFCLSLVEAVPNWNPHKSSKNDDKFDFITDFITMPRIDVTLKGQSELQTPNCLSFLRRAGWSFLFQNGRCSSGWCSWVLRLSVDLPEEIGSHSPALHLLAFLASVFPESHRRICVMWTNRRAEV